MELLGALAMCRLVAELLKFLYPDQQIVKYFWIDSQVVIHWLGEVSNRFKPFVASRVREIQDTHNNIQNEIRYIPSDLNPADKLTKPISVDQLMEWHQGPAFLYLSEEEWPENVKESVEVNSQLLELKPLPKSNKKRFKKRANVHLVDQSNVPSDLKERANVEQTAVSSDERANIYVVDQSNDDSSDFIFSILMNFKHHGFRSWERLLSAVRLFKNAFIHKSFSSFNYSSENVAETLI